MSNCGARLETFNRRKHGRTMTRGREEKPGESGQLPCLIAARDSGLVPFPTNASCRIHTEQHQQPEAMVSLLPKHKTTDEL